MRGISPGENVYRGDWDRELEWSRRGWDEAGAQALLTRSRYQSGARVRAELPSVTATFCVRFLLFVICKS